MNTLSQAQFEIIFFDKQSPLDHKLEGHVAAQSKVAGPTFKHLSNYRKKSFFAIPLLIFTVQKRKSHNFS